MKVKDRAALRYEYNGNIYKVIYISKMKIGQVWLPCVIYQSYKDKKIWVREHGDFFEKFKIHKDNENGQSPS